MFLIALIIRALWTITLSTFIMSGNHLNHRPYNLFVPGTLSVTSTSASTSQSRSQDNYPKWLENILPSPMPSLGPNGKGTQDDPLIISDCESESYKGKCISCPVQASL